MKTASKETTLNSLLYVFILSESYFPKFKEKDERVNENYWLKIWIHKWNGLPLVFYLIVTLITVAASRKGKREAWTHSVESQRTLIESGFSLECCGYAPICICRWGPRYRRCGSSGVIYLFFSRQGLSPAKDSAIRPCWLAKHQASTHLCLPRQTHTHTLALPTPSLPHGF